jgi:hypothetical protein
MNDGKSKDDSQGFSSLDDCSLAKKSIKPEEFNFFNKTSPNSCRTPNNNSNFLYLNKKRRRKNTDLNSNNQSPEFNSEKYSSPYNTDSKITNYFIQKKNSTNTQNINILGEQKMLNSTTKGNEMNYNYPFAKKLVFDIEEVGDKNSIDKKNLMCLNKLSNFNNETFRHTKILSKIVEDSDLKLDVSSNMINDSKYIGLSNKDFQISNKTYQILSQIRNKCIDKKNLNLQEIIKIFNTPNERETPKKRVSPKKSDALMKNVDKLINSISMKEKYEELLNRELILPSHYKNLYKKMMYLDEAISNFKIKPVMTMNLTLSNINNYLKEKYTTTMYIEEFQQILLITPHFYIYKWELINDHYEIIIDIPADIKQRIDETNVYNENTNFTQLQTLKTISILQPPDTDLLNKRSTFFKKILLQVTNEHHKIFLKDKVIQTKLNPFKHRTWHSEFDVHKVPIIEKFYLIPKPNKLIKYHK